MTVNKLLGKAIVKCINLKDIKIIVIGYNFHQDKTQEVLNAASS